MKRFTMFLGLGMALILGTAVWALVPSEAEGAVPKLINFQGILKNGSGNPVADGSYSITFRIYEVPAGGTLLWAETTSVTTIGGLFAVLLGASNPVRDTVFKGSNRWLGIAVSPDGEIAARQQLVSVGYAYRVNSVDSASGGTITSKLSIGPGHANTGANAFVAGESNVASGDWATVSGGTQDTASGDFATVSGGIFNTASNLYATVGGGEQNTASSFRATVGGGTSNTASDFNATVGGGNSNGASGNSSTVGGGLSNTASGPEATVGGGENNTASTYYATVGGGLRNTASNHSATVGGGGDNTASGFFSTVGGGQNNTTSLGQWATVPGGSSNAATADYSFAAGRRAKADHLGSFVWADSSVDADFASTAANQFLIRASGGVGIGTNSPTKALQIGAAGTANSEGMIRLESRSGTGTAQRNWEIGVPETDEDISGKGYSFVIDDVQLGTNPEFLVKFGTGNVGIGTTAPAAKLHVNGSAGNNTGVWSNLSDKRLKKDIEPIQNALETMNQLQPVSFRWKDSQKDAQFGRVRGLIAQDVEKVLPEWIKTDPDGYKRIEPIGVDALLIEAIKELKETVTTQAGQIAVQTSQIEDLKALVEKLAAEKKEGDKKLGQLR